MGNKKAPTKIRIGATFQPLFHPNLCQKAPSLQSFRKTKRSAHGLPSPIIAKIVFLVYIIFLSLSNIFVVDFFVCPILLVLYILYIYTILKLHGLSSGRSKNWLTLSQKGKRKIVTIVKESSFFYKAIKKGRLAFFKSEQYCLLFQKRACRVK